MNFYKGLLQKDFLVVLFRNSFRYFFKILQGRIREIYQGTLQRISMKTAWNTTGEIPEKSVEEFLEESAKNYCKNCRQKY